MSILFKAGAIESKNSKAAVSSGFEKIEGRNGVAPPCYRGVVWLGLVPVKDAKIVNFDCLSFVILLFSAP